MTSNNLSQWLKLSGKIVFGQLLQRDTGINSPDSVYWGLSLCWCFFLFSYPQMSFFFFSYFNFSDDKINSTWTIPISWFQKAEIAICPRPQTQFYTYLIRAHSTAISASFSQSTPHSHITHTHCLTDTPNIIKSIWLACEWSINF